MQAISQDGVIIHDKDAVGPAGDGLPAGHCVDRFERTAIGTPFGHFVFFSTQPFLCSSAETQDWLKS